MVVELRFYPLLLCLPFLQNSDFSENLAYPFLYLLPKCNWWHTITSESYPEINPSFWKNFLLERIFFFKHICVYVGSLTPDIAFELRWEQYCSVRMASVYRKEWCSTPPSALLICLCSLFIPAVLACYLVSIPHSLRIVLIWM